MSDRIRAPGGQVILNVDTAAGVDRTVVGSYLAGEPFRTLTHAARWGLHWLDWTALNTPHSTELVIQLAHGQVFDALHLPPHAVVGAQGGRGLTIRGGPGTIIRGVGEPAVGAYFGTVLYIEDVQLEGTNGLDCLLGANVYLDRVRWGPCAAAHINFLGFAHAQMAGPCSIVGNAKWHITTQAGWFHRMGHPLSVETDLSMTRFVEPFGPTMVNFSGPAIAMNGHTYQGGAPVPHPFVLAPDGGLPGS